MFTLKQNKHNKVANHFNKSLQLTTLVIGLSLVNSPALARKPMPANVPQNAITSAKEDGCVGQIANPAKLILPLGKSTLIKLPEPLATRSIGNPEVVQAKLITPQTLYLLGLDIGSTNMIIQGKSGTCTIIDVTVSMDPDGLQQILNSLLPEEKNIKVTAAADSLILSGTVEDAITANRAVDIASTYVRRRVNSLDVSKVTANNNQNNQQNNQQQMNQQNTDMVNPRIVNMLSVSAQQQVMLEVKIAEVSKTLLDKLGVDFGAYKINGSSRIGFGVLTPSVLANIFSTATGTGSIVPRFADNPVLGASKITNSSGRAFLLDAEKRDGLVKILAEPSIMAISGQEGSFLAGGTIFIPVSQNNNNGIPTVTLQEKEFGVGVKFTPTVLAGGRINLKVSPEVSDLNREGVGITATGISGTAILPSFTTRRASTTVQLLDGQSFAIGGLIKNNTTANIKAFPILGEIPIIGLLFRSTQFQKDKTELIFVVTPHLVKPLQTNENVRLPTDRYVDPSRADIFLGGKLEGVLPPNAPPPLILDKKSEALKPDTPAPADDTGFDVR